MTEKERNGSETDTEVKVTDRRQFTPDGQLRADAAETAFSRDDESPTEPSTAESGTPETEESGFEHRPVEEPKGVDFTMLINAMAEPALLFLGEIAYPGTSEPSVDLERARIQIDMLDLLRVKCRGNMTPDEENLLDRILYQLRMLCVAKANQPVTK